MNSNNVQTISARKILDEVSFIRPILIVLLVLYHSLCLHTGKWKPINGMEIIPFYRDLGLFVYLFSFLDTYGVINARGKTVKRIYGAW